jgi:hypothetical protein
MNKICTAKMYEIEIDDLMEIINADQNANDEGDWDEILVERLSLVPGVTDVDYSGHFGHYVFLTLEAEYDNDDNWELIEKEIIAT